MHAHPYLLAAGVALLAACSDTTGPTPSNTEKTGASAAQPTGGGTRQPGGIGHPVPLK